MTKNPFSFNVNAELYENDFGELAIRFEGNDVYRGVGLSGKSTFVEDARKHILGKEHPGGWKMMPPHELLYGRGWHCISLMGFIDGDIEKTALELEVKPEELGERAKSYLTPLFGSGRQQAR